MKRSGAALAVFALEQVGVKYTFGIPGVHNTELYDALNSSEKITPILVTHEGCASFMADAVSRTSGSIGTCVIVPAAGMTHAMSGIGEAFLDGIPMLIVSGGTRRDTGRHFQLHQLDQGRVLDGLVKKYFLIEKHSDIIPTIYKAYDTATSGTPGPVFIEIPAEIQMFTGVVDDLTVYDPSKHTTEIDVIAVKEAARLLLSAKRPCIYVGWGAVDAGEATRQIAEWLAAPVSTTLQGLSAFPANHPLHTGVGFGPSGVPAARKAFEDCDVLLAAGARFSELATGSYGMKIPGNLIHVDINPDVFNKNYPARVAIRGDAAEILKALYVEIKGSDLKISRSADDISHVIKAGKESYREEWANATHGDKVSPGLFFHALRERLPDEAIVVADDGAHTFLAAELFPVHRARGFISPTDFNSMGYCVPATIAAKLANPGIPVVGIVGDGAFMMTGLETVTATTHGLGIILFIFNDGELGQISQFQQIPLNRKTCTQLGVIRFEGIAMATGAEYFRMNANPDISGVLDQAFQAAEKNVPVIVDVNIDYSKKTFLTKGVVKTNLSRFPVSEKIRFITRAIMRHVTG